MNKNNHRDILHPVTAPFYKIKNGESYLVSLHRHDLQYEKCKRKNGIKLSGLSELFNAIYIMLEDLSFAAKENPEVHYDNLTIEYSNRFGYYKRIRLGDFLDIKNFLEVLNAHSELFLGQESPYIHSAVFKALLSKKSQSFDYLFIDTGDELVSKELNEHGIIHHKCGFVNPLFEFGKSYCLYVLKSEADANLGMLTCFKKMHRIIDLREIRKELFDCLKIVKQ